MTVHFKGISEYQNKYKVRHRRSRSASPHRRMRLAGLRSDEQGISREPQFQTKRRVPINPPQVSSSLQWKGSSVLSRQQDITKPRSPPGVPGALTCSEEKVETPLAPRASQPQEEEVPSAQTQDPSADQHKRRTPSNQLNHVLRRKAGLKSECRTNGVWDSEYHGQFQWKTPVSESPLLTAQQMLYKGNRRIPPFKSGPAVMESEYMRSFKGSPPPRPPRLRQDVELNAVSLSQMENPSPDKSQKKKKKKKQKQKEQHLSRGFSPKQEALPQEPAKQKVTSPRAQNHVSPKVKRKPKTEYSSNFHSPLQYCYRDGMWVKSRTLGEEVHMWHHEVQELREKAEAYRKRAWGTHFCRQHLSQIMSTQNYLWEASSSASSPSPSEEDDCSSSSSIIEALDLARVDSVGGNSSRGTSVTMTTGRRSSAEGAGTSKGPTLPVQRKLAWEEEAGPCERGVAQIKEQREEPTFQQPMETEEREAINRNLEDKKNEVTVTGNDTLSPEDVSAHLSEEGRVPTPKMKIMLHTQRTHDRTTPATGGAVLVSPPKTHCTRRTRRSEPPLGKADSPYRHLSHGSPPQAHSKAESGCRPCSVLAAGTATADPLPLSEDVWAADGSTASPEPTPARTPHKLAARASAGSPPHVNRIQGTLRNPEFQHNGNLGLHRPGTFLSPSSDSGVSDNDDRMSQISCRSAASCFMASQVLDRAHRRKQEFWGRANV